MDDAESPTEHRPVTKRIPTPNQSSRLSDVTGSWTIYLGLKE